MSLVCSPTPPSSRSSPPAHCSIQSSCMQLPKHQILMLIQWYGSGKGTDALTPSRTIITQQQQLIPAIWSLPPLHMEFILDRSGITTQVHQQRKTTVTRKIKPTPPLILRRSTPIMNSINSLSLVGKVPCVYIFLSSANDQRTHLKFKNSQRTHYTLEILK